VALQVAAGAPKYVRVEDIPAEILEQEREKARNLGLAEGKPENVINRIVDGKMEKYYNENCLLRQTYVRDENMTLEDLRNQHIAAIGENIVIRRFARWEVGEEAQS
jgi:elongation factor Ts